MQQNKVYKIEYDFIKPNKDKTEVRKYLTDSLEEFIREVNSLHEKWYVQNIKVYMGTCKELSLAKVLNPFEEE